MKKLLLGVLFISTVSYAEDDITIKIDWVENVANSKLLEVCGTAISKSGKWPLLISVIHGESVFSTVTNSKNRYCQLVSRQNFSGNVMVEAISFDKKSTKTQSIELK